MGKIHKSPLVVGLTGGIGAGKSTIVQTIREMGIPVFDCDAYVHELYLKPENIEYLSQRYGDMDGRPKQIMAAKAWTNPDIRKELESFFLPQVSVGILGFIDQHVSRERQVIVIDAPTLLEHGFQVTVDWIMIVDAPVMERWARVSKRPGMTEQKFQAVLKAQVTDDTRRREANSVIFNDGPLADAVDQTRTLFTKLRRIISA